jgi:Xaa-Pro aminopeptidase
VRQFGGTVSDSDEAAGGACGPDPRPVTDGGAGRLGGRSHEVGRSGEGARSGEGTRFGKGASSGDGAHSGEGGGSAAAGPLAPGVWPPDEPKLARMRGLMADRELDALVVRAPDNVLYLSSYLSMKGYDVLVFPRQGEPVLCVLEPQEADAHRTAWPGEIRLFKGYDERDPRPATARSLELAQAVVRERGYERIGLELSQGTQTADLMVGEPTTPTLALFEGFPGRVDASPFLAEARAIKTEQEIERMRLANELAALAMEHVAERIRPGMTEAEAAALWEGHVHAVGVGFEGKVGTARGYSLVWSGPGIRTFTATSNRPVQEHEPTLFEIWVCADGYWCDHTKNVCPGRLRPEYERLLEALLAIFAEAQGHVRDGAPLAELDRLIRARTAEAGYPGQPSHPVCHGVGARAHEPPYAHQAGGGDICTGMVLAIEPGIYWEGGGGLRVEDNFLVGPGVLEKLCRFPDDFRTAP